MFNTRSCLLCHKVQRHFSFLLKEWQMGYFCQHFVCLSAHKDKVAAGNSGAFLFCTLFLLPVSLWKWVWWAWMLKFGMGMDKINFINSIFMSRKTQFDFVFFTQSFLDSQLAIIIHWLTIYLQCNFLFDVCILFLIALVFCGRVFLCVQNKASFYSVCLKAIPFVSSQLLMRWNPDSTKSTILPKLNFLICHF